MLLYFFFAATVRTRFSLLRKISNLNEAAGGLVNQMCHADIRLYVPEDLMVKVDRVSMAVGLEVRAVAHWPATVMPSMRSVGASMP